MGAKRLCLEDRAAETVKLRAAGLGVYIALNTEGRRYLATPAMVLALPVVSAWSWYNNVVGCVAVKAANGAKLRVESPKSGSPVFPSHLQLQIYRRTNSHSDGQNSRIAFAWWFTSCFQAVLGSFYTVQANCAG